MKEKIEEMKGRISGWDQLSNAVFCILICLVIAGACLGLYRWSCLTFIDNYEIGYKYSFWGGGIERVHGNGPNGRGGGYIWAPFWLYGAHTVDMRPMQVCINANQRVLNCKLVQFNPDGIDPVSKEKGLEQFLSWHGRNDYKGPGNTSSNSPGGKTTFSEILKSYAYEGTGKVYPFLTIIRELKSDQTGTPQ